MYFGLINLIYFVTCSYMFLSKSYFENINIISFGVVAFIYALTLFLFCFDPDPFDYFRYAFKKSQVAMTFYYVYPFILVICALVLIMFTQTWPPMIPFILLLPYILIYRPYREVH